MDAKTKQFALQIKEFLCEFLTDEEILTWKLDKPIDSYNGAELRKFAINFGFLSQQIEEKKLIDRRDPKWKALLNAMCLWPSLSYFVQKAKIEDGDDYLEQVDTFE